MIMEILFYFFIGVMALCAFAFIRNFWTYQTSTKIGDLVFRTRMSALERGDLEAYKRAPDYDDYLSYNEIFVRFWRWSSKPESWRRPTPSGPHHQTWK